MDKAALKKIALWAHDELMHGGADSDAESATGARAGTQAREDAAVTWFVQVCALRYMQVNGVLPIEVQALLETEGVERALDCEALREVLPGFFASVGDRDRLSPKAQGAVIRRVWADIPSDWFDVRSGCGQIEIVGWLYQYFLSERHDEVVDPLYGKCVAAQDIPVATQVFTTDWVVRYIVDNTLGRLWIEHHPDSSLASQWEYYVPRKSLPHAGTLRPQDIRVIDPCVGSGHFLVYAVDVLIKIYRECGYSDVDAIVEIMQSNIFGLDIDEKTVRIAYFALMMKGCQVDPDFLRRKCVPQIYTFCNSDFVDAAFLDAIRDARLRAEAEKLAAAMRNARVTGSMTPIPRVSFDAWMHVDVPATKRDAWATLLQTARLLSMTYSVVITNPPYLNQYDPELKAFIHKNYKDYSRDLFSVFIYRCIAMCSHGGYCGMMTPNVWMFIRSYEKLRRHIVTEHSITTLVQMAKGAFFQDATVDVCAFVMQNGVPGLEGEYFRLDGFTGDMECQRRKLLDALRDPECGYRYRVSSQLFSAIPGMPIGYWADDAILRAFRDGKALGTIAAPRQGLATTDNRKYLRHWYEVDFGDIGFGLDRATATASDIRWFPYNKGGEFRKWYGNQDYIVDYQYDGKEIKRDVMAKYPYLKNPGYVVKNPDTYFCPSLSWSKISSGRVAFRFFPQGFLYDVSGCSLFFENDDDLLTLAGFLNSVVCSRILEIVSPTVNYEAGHIGILPVLDVGTRGERIRELVRENIRISREDWDTTEMSWNFVRHPLLPARGVRHATIAECYRKWASECEDRFVRMKQNEEELNRIFADLYGLDGTVDTTVRDRDVTVRRADLRRDVKSLISYAVGCMFGRYSPEIDGLLPTTSEAHVSEILPMTEDGSFPDDVVSQFLRFLSTVFGPESLEENLAFIAQALGGKGTPREVIRAFFWRGFYADHYRTYQKCPIYWQFASGKTLQCLVYIHRYRPDTVERIRTEYVEPLISRGLGVQCSQNLELFRYAQKLRELAIPIDLQDGIRANIARFADVLTAVK